MAPMAPSTSAAAAPSTVAVAAADFDAKKTIESFLQDEATTGSSLELPSSLTAEQRKQVKKIVEQYNGALRCESYGFGADRQMHVFKVAEKSPADSSAGSTAAFNSTSNSPRDVQQQQQPTKKELQVRNTFIHFEETSKAKDERVVQSMPDGVFRQHLLAEAAERAAASGCGVVPPAEKSSAETLAPVVEGVDPLQQDAALAPGMQVCVHGLVRAPAFNGRSGIVQAFDAETARFSVLLNMENGMTQLAKIKADNLRRMADASERPRPQGLADFDVPMSPATGYQVNMNFFPGTPLWEERIPERVVAPLRLTALV